jgi:hypothetical protein
VIEIDKVWDLDRDFDFDFDRDFDRTIYMRLPCLPPAILTEQGSLNPTMSGQTPGTTRLSAHGLVGVAIREIYFPSDAARLMKHGELDSVRTAGRRLNAVAQDLSP